MNPQDSYLPETDGPIEAREKESYPIGFKVAVGLTAIYLLYRLGQGVLWLISRLIG